MEEAAQHPLLGLDTESDSFYRYPERLCLIQLAAGSHIYLIDTLALKHLDPLQVILEDERIEKIFHASEYDVTTLRRRCPSLKKIANMFDTMAASRILGWKELGLAALLQKHFNVRLDKEMQRSDWGIRPLSQQQIHYAAQDVRHLSVLRDLQVKELRSIGRWEEAQEEFHRLAKSKIPEPEFDPEGFRYLKGARDLNPAELSRLRELYLLREQEAKARHLPHFKIMTSEFVTELAQHAPQTPAELEEVRGASPYILRNYGSKILAALERAAQNPEVGPGPAFERELTRAQAARYGHLKDWRKAVAEKRGVAPDVILSNEALKKIAKTRPADLDALTALKVMGPWKLKEYGEALIAALNK